MDVVTANRRANPDGMGRLVAWVKGYLPEGRGLPQHEWQIRHRAVVWIIFGHAVGLAIFGLAQGWGAEASLGEGAVVAALGLVANSAALSRRMRSGVAAFACVVSSAILVQFSGGVIEAHFHFFVIVALISLYQDWVPFLLAIAFVAIDHGLLGTLFPDWVYNHAGAIAHPWKWAGIHAVMVLAESVALIVVWRANEQARAETDRVLRSAGEGLLGVDASCNVTFANPAALRMSGRSEQDLLGKPLYSMLLAADGRPMFGADVLRQNPGAFTVESFMPTAGGGHLPVEVLCTPIEGHGHEEGAVIAIRDLTDRLRAEEERTHAQSQHLELERLKEVNSFKTRFMNMAAHELNTPLTPIKVQMHLLKNRSAGPALEPHRNSINMLDRNFQRLYGLVQDLLDSTRLQGDRLPVRPAPSDLAPVLRDVGESFRPAAAQAGIDFKVVVPDALTCAADTPRVTQAVSNLLVNALKFTPSSGAITLTGRDNGDAIEVEVRDTGVGMDQAQLARLFQPFEQVHESQIASHQGSGLGLYISRGIVELHGGRISAASDGPGKGSSFRFTIPKVAPVERPEPPILAPKTA